jgi:PAS domain S-box-containing protein
MAVDSRPLILIVDDDPGVALLMRHRLERANYRVAVATTVTAASQILAQGGVELVLMDYNLGSTTSGLDFHRRMKTAGFDVPVIVVCAAMDDATVIEALRAGVRDVVLKDTEYLDYLPETVRAVLQQGVAAIARGRTERSGGNVLIVEDDAGTAKLERLRLERAGYQVVLATTAEEAVAIVATGQVSLAVIDLRLPGNTSGLDLYEQLKAQGWNIPSILVTAYPDQAVAIRALRVGVRDFIAKSSDYLDYLPAAVDRVASQIQIERRLVDSEVRFASIIGTTMDAIAMCDEHLYIVLFNRSAEEMFECSASEAMKQRLDRFIPDLPSGLDTGAGSSTLQRRIEVDAFTALGRPLPVEVSVSEVVVQGKRFFTVIARDISERRTTEAQLREADRRKDEFLGMLAHELRNPLAAIMNATELLSRGLNKGPRQKAASVLQRQTHTLARMVDDLLDVSRVTLGKIRLNTERLRLDQVIARSIDNVRAAANLQQLHLHVAVDPEPIWVQADATRLEQIFVNLLNNAIKFTPAGGSVTIQAVTEDAHGVVRVNDTGIGIEPSLLPRVFDLFVQGDASLDRAKSGLGIGLALVKQLVLMHGGKVTAHSEGQQRGAQFEVRLPLADDAAATLHVAGLPGARPPHPYRVLVVDDQCDIADSLTMLLQLYGHEARAVYEGSEALATVRAEPYDAMVIDIGMPEMSGYDVARCVREDAAIASLHLIAMTGYGKEQDRAHAIEAGFDVHLTKPVSMATLEAVLANNRPAAH